MKEQDSREMMLEPNFLENIGNAWRALDPKTRELLGTVGLLLLFALLRRSTTTTSIETRPPFNAEYLLYVFLRTEEREAVIGDLVECHTRMIRRFGKRRADLWFCKQVLDSLLPLIRRAIVKIGTFVWLGRILRRLIS